MKKAIILLALVLTLGSCSNSSTTSDSQTTNFQLVDTTKLSKGQTFYQCPMDLEIISEKSGSCPKCGMDLEKVEKK